MREELLAHLLLHPDAMAKSGPPAHFTASCVVLDAGLERVLLTLHRRAREWFQFGGHLEAGDASVRDAAAREAAEESGLAQLRLTPSPVQLDRHALVGDFGRCREHLDLRYAARAPQDARAAVSDESLDVRWWPVSDLPPGTRDELAPLVRAARVVLQENETG